MSRICSFLWEEPSQISEVTRALFKLIGREMKLMVLYMTDMSLRFV